MDIDMNSKEHIFFTLIGWLFIASTIVPASALAQAGDPSGQPPGAETKQPLSPDAQDQRVWKKPPQRAVDACRGKEEGNPCTFTAAEGILDGDCHVGIEAILACRPFRGASSPQVEKKSVSEQRAVPQPQPQPEGKTREVTAPKQTEHPLSSPPKRETPERQSRSDQTAQAELPVVPAPTATHEKTWFTSGGVVSYLVVALLAAGLTWYAFFRYITVPLRRLRKVTQQLACGNLSSRVGEGLVSRTDEVADLGRDVDRMAERIEKLVGAHQRLIRDVSHELRSPLARLNVALELARQSTGPTHSAPFDRIERESDRLNELIGQLLMLTQLESESGSFQREIFDITAVITDIAQDADFEAKNNGRRVVVTTSEPLLLSGNKELLRQAVENLVRNAVRYTAPETSVEISLGKKESCGHSWAHIEVKDHGPGVPESELNDIFRPFYRVNVARERQSGGTGVGLAISDRAVRLHGGSIRAFNASGSGLTMELELPLG